MQNINECAALALTDVECSGKISYFGFEIPYGDYQGRCMCVLRNMSTVVGCGTQYIMGLGLYQRGAVPTNVQPPNAW